MPRLEDTAFTLVEFTNRVDQRFMLVIGLITHGNEYFRRGRLINEVVLPLTGLALVMYRRIKRGITPKAPVHVNYLLIRNTEVFRNQRHMIGVHIAALQCWDFVF